MTNRVVVFGGAGFIGSHVVDELAAHGDMVLVIDNLAAGSLENLRGMGQILIVDPTTPIGFVRASEAVAKFVPTHIIDLAAEPYIPDSFASVNWSVGAFRSNVDLVLASAQIGLQNRSNLKRYLYISTSEVYGTAVDNKPMTEDHRINPQSTYAVSKLAAERLVLNWRYEHGLPTVVIRQFNTYGPRSTHPYVIPTIISQLFNEPRVHLGNVDAERDFLYVTDAAKRIVETLYGDVYEGVIYNSGSDETVSILGLFRALKEILYPSLEVELKPYDVDRMRPHDVNRLLCCSDRLISRIDDWEMVSLEEGLKKTCEYYRERGSWLWEVRLDTDL